MKKNKINIQLNNPFVIPNDFCKNASLLTIKQSI